jgi:predicted nucleotidyltransferase component of viral defense system
MHENVKSMLKRYSCTTGRDYKNALKEIIQEIALFGLWRTKFFEHTAFYGGTALRVLYGLDRFSEDLDFSLLKPDPAFDLSRFENGLRNEIESFGFTIEIGNKVKQNERSVRSAFIKANTRMHMLRIGAPESIQDMCQSGEQLKIKFEVETDPPPGFQIETIAVTQPLPFAVRSYTLPSLFAGKLHALLCRQWGRRVKGRDWYDFVWYVGRKVPVDIAFLDAKMRQSGSRKEGAPLKLAELIQLICERSETLDIDLAKDDVFRFIDDPRSIEVWSPQFFQQIAQQMHAL